MTTTRKGILFMLTVERMYHAILSESRKNLMKGRLDPHEDEEVPFQSTTPYPSPKK